MNLKSATHWTWRVVIAVVFGTLGAGGIVGAFAITLHYVAPAENATPTAIMLSPIVEDGWIKMPFTIMRTKECLANSTLTLRRTHDYGGQLGVREDVVTLGLYNTTITGLGLTPVMLWFRQPQDLGPGKWAYDGKSQDDCGGIGDLFNFSAQRPRTTVVPGVLVIP